MGPESAQAARAAPGGRPELPGPGSAGAERDGTSEERDGTTGRQRGGPREERGGNRVVRKGQSEKGTQDLSEKL